MMSEFDERNPESVTLKSEIIEKRLSKPVKKRKKNPETRGLIVHQNTVTAATLAKALNHLVTFYF